MIGRPTKPPTTAAEQRGTTRSNKTMSTSGIQGERRRLRRILRLPEVEAMTGRKRTAIYDAIAVGKFPPPVPLGERAVGWLEDEIADWVEGRIAEREARRAVTAA
jgi:prophage regulatory protein